MNYNIYMHLLEWIPKGGISFGWWNQGRQGRRYPLHGQGRRKGQSEEIQHEVDIDNQMILMKRYMQVKEVEKGISSFLGAVINK